MKDTMRDESEEPVLLVRGCWIVSGPAPSDPVYTDAALAVAHGRVTKIGDWRQLREEHPRSRVIGSEHTAVLPGLINAHHHSSGVTGLQQSVADDLLEPWLLSLSALRDTDPYLDVLLSAARLLRSGVTSVVEVKSGKGDAAAYDRAVTRGLEAYDESGMRVAYATGVSTRSHLVSGDDEAFIASLPTGVQAHARRLMPGAGRISEDEYFDIVDRRVQAYADHPLIDIWYAPPGPQWVSDDFMQRMAERAAERDCGIQTHVNESFYEKLHGLRSYGKDTVLHLRDLGVLSPRFSIAHGVWLTEAEIDALAGSGAAVSHNPSSNLRLRAGIAPLNSMLARGVGMGLGMDGTTLNDDEDMFTEMRLAMRLNRGPVLGAPAPAPRDVFHMATVGGATLMRRQSRLGKLAPDFHADLVVLDVTRLSWPWVAPEIDPVELILARARASDVRTVLVGGEVAWQDGAPTGFDQEAAGREMAQRLAATPYPADRAAAADRLRPYVERYYSDWALPETAPYTHYNSRR